MNITARSQKITKKKERLVRFEDIHEIKGTDFDLLSNAVVINNGDVILDAGAGYGAVTRELAVRNKDKISTYYLTDIDYKQLIRAETELANALGNQFVEENVRLLVDDFTSSILEDNSIDKVIAKMLIHEFPLKVQQTAINQAYRMLKKGGTFIVWDFVPDTDLQILFQDMVRKKDELAGFHDLVTNRYFFTEEELVDMLLLSGFCNIRFEAIIPFAFSTLKRLESELLGDMNKLMEWNDFVRDRINHLSPGSKAKLIYKEDGENLTVLFRGGIFSCSKP